MAFNQDEAPIKILHHAVLGDALLAFSERTPEPPQALVQYVRDPRVDELILEVGRLIGRVQDLEAQTPFAYWSRLRAWIVGLWRWR